VLVEDIDAQGKISLKPVGPEWEVPEGTDPNGGGGGERRPRDDRGGRGGGERGGRGGERSGVSSGGGGGDKPRGKRFRDQPAGERTDTPPAE
jgi:hypothetical protein